MCWQAWQQRQLASCLAAAQQQQQGRQGLPTVFFYLKKMKGSRSALSMQHAVSVSQSALSAWAAAAAAAAAS